MTGTLMFLLLTIPPDIITVVDITPDDSDPLNLDDPKAIIATVEYNTNCVYTVFIYNNYVIVNYCHQCYTENKARGMRPRWLI